MKRWKRVIVDNPEFDGNNGVFCGGSYDGHEVSRS